MLAEENNFFNCCARKHICAFSIQIKDPNSLDEETETLLRQRLAPDYLLYDHFKIKFESLVQSYGAEAMARDLESYEHLTLKTKLKCGFKPVDGDKMENLPGRIKTKVGVKQIC